MWSWEWCIEAKSFNISNSKSLKDAVVCSCLYSSFFIYAILRLTVSLNLSHGEMKSQSTRILLKASISFLQCLDALYNSMICFTFKSLLSLHRSTMYRALDSIFVGSKRRSLYFVDKDRLKAVSKVMSCYAALINLFEVIWALSSSTCLKCTKGFSEPGKGDHPFSVCHPEDIVTFYEDS